MIARQTSGSARGFVQKSLLHKNPYPLNTICVDPPRSLFGARTVLPRSSQGAPGRAPGSSHGSVADRALARGAWLTRNADVDDLNLGRPFRSVSRHRQLTQKSRNDAAGRSRMIPLGGRLHRRGAVLYAVPNNVEWLAHVNPRGGGAAKPGPQLLATTFDANFRCKRHRFCDLLVPV